PDPDMACKLLCLLVVFAIITFVTHGSEPHCGLNDVSLRQSKSGMVESKPVWKVTLNNPCICLLTNLKLSCTGFESVVPVDTLIKTGDVCVLNKGIQTSFSNMHGILASSSRSLMARFAHESFRVNSSLIELMLFTQNMFRIFDMNKK
ncbi:hypothetical protein HID58_048674, partial [Brassica napus]